MHFSTKKISSKIIPTNENQNDSRSAPIKPLPTKKNIKPQHSKLL
jgi:hypothetical protein